MTDTDPPDPAFHTKTSCIQLMYGIWVNMASMAIGLASGFPAIHLPQLNSPDSSIVVSMEEGSWIASVSILFCPLGCLISGYMMDKFGRRTPILGCQIPLLCGWLCTGTAKSARNMIIGRAIIGIGSGMAMGAPRVYTSEISLANMRGMLGALPNIFLSLGIAVQAAMGALMEWKKICYISCSLNVILFFSYLLLKETPHYLMCHDTINNTRKALTHFRSKNYPVDREIEQLIEFKRANNIRSLTMWEQIKTMFSQATCKPFGIAMTFIGFGCLSGVQVVTTWTIDILTLTHSSFDVNAGNFIIALTRLIFGMIGSILLYHVGRRPISLISAFGVGSSSVAIGVCLLLKPEPSLAPQILFMIYTASAIMGFQCVPFLLMSEMYPLQVRGMLTGISLTLTNIMIFLITKHFPYLHKAIGIKNTLFIFGSSALCAVIFLYFVLPETKGLTLQEIEEYFRGIRSTLVSERSVIEAQLQQPTLSETYDEVVEGRTDEPKAKVDEIKDVK